MIDDDLAYLASEWFREINSSQSEENLQAILRDIEDELKLPNLLEAYSTDDRKSHNGWYFDKVVQLAKFLKSTNMNDRKLAAALRLEIMDGPPGSK